MDHNLLLQLALILFASKLLSALFRRMGQPPVIGMLLLGVVLGQLCLVHDGEVIRWIARIGVLFLLFEAGLETDLKRIREEARRAALPALGGVVLPFGGGFLLSWLQNGQLFHSLVIGIIMTATSVSVSVMTLMDLGKMKGAEGRCIVNAAILDDILGILLLSFVFGLAAGHGAPGEATVHGAAGLIGQLLPLLKIVGFFVAIVLLGRYFFIPLFHNLSRLNLEASAPALAVVAIFFFGWLAEYAEIAAITGAYFAGLFIGQTGYRHTVQREIASAGRLLFIDVFFVHIGLMIDLKHMHSGVAYLAAFIAIALVTKFVGSMAGARLSGFDTLRSLRVGIGMMPRGEVALIVAGMAMQRQLIGPADYSATIMAVIVSAFITPILLKISYTRLQRKTF
ncbi:MAG: cation:proton antiporter [Candidatus Cloacimonetes bacterium]|nr:cation:proton antiporter [Candidatus Cloacimonadota bacterium]